MQHATAPTPSPTSPSFAGLLAALAAPAQKSTPAWNDDDLADDVAILSYEHALRTHGRYRAAESDDRPFTQPPVPEPERSRDVPPAAAAQAAPPVPAEHAGDGTESRRLPFTHYEKNLKCASITIRLSEAECAQLRTRAAEAGLTVSAYLRSCTFEAELLRAQVKEALAELRSAASKRMQPAPASSRRSWLEWLTRFRPHWSARQRMAQA